MKVRILRTESSFWHSSLVNQVVEVEELELDEPSSVYKNFYLVPHTSFNLEAIPLEHHDNLARQALYLLKSRTEVVYASNKEAAALLSEE